MLTVLIADDDPFTLDCLKQFIHWEEINCELVDTASNGAIAHDVAIEKGVDVIITDIKMPIMDGLELCRKLRENNHNMTIIFLSAYDDFHTAQIAMHYHVTDYILKPLSHNTITMLENILIKIQRERKSKKSYLTIMNSNEFKEHIQTALKEENLLFFDSFFEELNSDFNVDFNTVQLICIKMLDLIYDFVYSGVNICYTVKKQNAISALISMNSKNAAVDYVHEIYQSVFQHSVHTSQKNYDTIIESTKQYIRSNYHNSWFGVNDVADHFFFSVPHLNRIFKTTMHMTVSEYIGKLRMDKAVELLMQTDLPVNKISAQVGYTSDNYFIRIFKNKFQVTPTEYRRKRVLD